MIAGRQNALPLDSDRESSSMTTAGFGLLALSLLLGLRANSLDKALRHLLPARIERRWFGDLTASAPIGGQVESAIRRILPRHWQPEVHSEHGVSMVAQLYLCLALAWCFGMMGLMLIAGDVSPTV
jgi:hypothetical protein